MYVCMYVRMYVRMERNINSKFLKCLLLLPQNYNYFNYSSMVTTG